MWSWAALAAVILHFFLMSGQRYRHGWYVALVACILWGTVAISIKDWALLAQQFVIGGFAVRGLRNL